MSATPNRSTARGFAPSPQSIKPPTQTGRFLSDHSNDDEHPMAQAQGDLMAGDWEMADVDEVKTARSPVSSQESIEPPSRAGRFLADHLVDEDPMAQAQGDLMEGDWEMGGVEDHASGHYPSPPATQRLVSQHNPKPESYVEDFEDITHADIAELNNPAYQHEQHVRNMAKHIVPPYPIPSQHAFMSELEDQSKDAQMRRFEQCMKQYYPGAAEQRKTAMDKANRDFPRYGLTSNVHIVHVNGETREASKWDQTKCDETCPAYKGKSLFGKLKVASGRLVKDMAFDTPS